MRLPIKAITTVITLFFVLLVQVSGEEENITDYDLIVLYKNYNKEEKVFKKKSILRNVQKLHITPMMESILGSRAMKSNPQKVTGYLMCASKGMPRIKYLTIRLVEEKEVVRWGGKWIKVSSIEKNSSTKRTKKE